MTHDTDHTDEDTSRGVQGVQASSFGDRQTSIRYEKDLGSKVFVTEILNF